MSRLYEKYKTELRDKIQKELKLDNVMRIPRLEKIVVNSGVGEASQNIKILDKVMEEIGIITGQKPVMRRAKKSIAAFRLRTGMPIGLKTTLRGNRMWYFFDKLVNAVLPRTHEFQGVSPDSFDGRGNYTIGLKEQILFPEIDYDKIDKVRGMEICIITTAEKDEDGRHLLELLGMPFAKDGAS